jgi:hypothetical protein
MDRERVSRISPMIADTKESGRATAQNDASRPDRASWSIVTHQITSAAVVAIPVIRGLDAA